MIALDEDALICDMAETYHIYNMEQLPVEYVATLANGLRDNSRIKMKAAGLRVDVQTLLMAHIADNTAINTWFKTEDGQKNQNRPPSMLQILTGNMQQEIGFDSGNEFEKKWRELTSE